MKKFLLLLFLSGVALAVTPSLIGSRVEQLYQQLTSQLEQVGFDVVEQHYQRGWLGAAAETRFRIRVPDTADTAGQFPDMVGFTLHSDISHGSLTAAGLGLAVIESRIEVEGEAFPGADHHPAQITTRVALDGSGTTRLELAALDRPAAKEKPQVQFAGITGKIHFDREFGNISIRLDMAGLRVGDEEGGLVDFGAASLDSRSWRGSTGLTLGAGRFELKHLRFQDVKTGGRVAIRGLSIDINSSEQDARVAGGVDYRLASAMIGDKAYGPAVLDFEVSGISAPVLVKMQQELERMRQQHLSDQQQGLEIMHLMMRYGPELLKQNPGVALKQLRVVAPQGVVEGAFSVRAPGLTWREIGDNQAMMNKLKADLSFRLPESLFQQLLELQAQLQIQQRRIEDETVEEPTPEALQSSAEAVAGMQLAQLLSLEIVERDGEYIATEAQLGDGLLTVNGKTVPVPLITR